MLERETKCPESHGSKNKQLNTGGILEDTPEVNLVPSHGGRQAGRRREERKHWKPGSSGSYSCHFSLFPRSHTGMRAHR